MSIRRFFRTLLGLILLAAFAYTLFNYYQTSPKHFDPETTAPVETAAPADKPVPKDTEAPSEPAPAETEAEPTAAPPEATPEPTLDPDSPAGRAAALGLPAPPDIDIDSWEYILANEYNPIGEYAPQGPATLEGQGLDERIVDAMKAMVADTRAQNLSVVLASGYRSYNDQLYLARRRSIRPTARIPTASGSCCLPAPASTRPACAATSPTAFTSSRTAAWPTPPCIST